MASLLTKEIWNSIPRLYSQDGKGDSAKVFVKFFGPGRWTWYATEADAIMMDGSSMSLRDAGYRNREVEDVEFFGLVVGGYGDIELGYFRLSELQSSPRIKREIYGHPETIGEARKEADGNTGGYRSYKGLNMPALRGLVQARKERDVIYIDPLGSITIPLVGIILEACLDGTLLTRNPELVEEYVDNLPFDVSEDDLSRIIDCIDNLNLEYDLDGLEEFETALIEEAVRPLRLNLGTNDDLISNFGFSAGLPGNIDYALWDNGAENVWIFSGPLMAEHGPLIQHLVKYGNRVPPKFDHLLM